MGKKIHYDPSKVNNMPKGSKFVQLSYELINSPAWRNRSINCIRIIEFLILENIRHSGQENGYLLATYDQLEEFGIARGNINYTIAEAVSLGLIAVNKGRSRGYANSSLNRFRLTFLRSKNIDSTHGGIYYTEPTNEWQIITLQDVSNQKKGRRLYKEKRKQRKLKSQL